MKTKIEVDGKTIEVDLEKMSEEELKNYDINITNKKEESNKKRVAIRKIRGIIPLVVLMAFFLCGFLIEGGFRWSWSLFFLIPILESLLSVRNRNIRRIASGILTILIIGGTIFLGSFFHIWTWCWVFFFLVPIVYIILE